MEAVVEEANVLELVPLAMVVDITAVNVVDESPEVKLLMEDEIKVVAVLLDVVSVVGAPRPERGQTSKGTTAGC